MTRRSLPRAPRRLGLPALGVALALITAATACTNPLADRPLPQSASPPPGLSVDPAALTAALEETAQSYNLPGAVAGVWIPDAPEWVGTVGDVKREDHFPIRSVTKSFTVTLLLQLVDEGLVSLDDPISDYVDGVPGGDKVTLRDLAAMTSGLADYTDSKEFLEKFSADPGRQWTAQQLIDLGLEQKSLFPAGEKYNYSNTNTLLVGEVVEKVGDTSLEEAYRTRIWERLDMTGTSYPDSANLPEPTAPPFLVDGAAREPAPVVNLSSLGAAGGMVSTLDDLHRWGEALGSGELVGPSLQLDRQQSARPATEGPEYESYGLGIGQIGGYWGHTGEGIGYNAAVFRQTGTGAVIVVLVNSSQDVNAATKIFEALAEEVGTPI